MYVRGGQHLVHAEDDQRPLHRTDNYRLRLLLHCGVEIAATTFGCVEPD